MAKLTLRTGPDVDTAGEMRSLLRELVDQMHDANGLPWGERSDLDGEDMTIRLGGLRYTVGQAVKGYQLVYGKKTA